VAGIWITVESVRMAVVPGEIGIQILEHCHCNICSVLLDVWVRRIK
jgi:hypothetical protein